MNISHLLGAITIAGMLSATGCATGAAGLGDEAGTTQLPPGLRLIDSTEGECDDSVHVGAESSADARLGPQLFVEPGQNATFAIRETPVRWACIDDDSQDFHEFRCGAEATYVRFTRATDGGELLLECFG